MAEDPRSDEQVLRDPGGSSVEEVLDVFARSEPDEVAAAQEIEAQGRKRAGVLKYEHPRLKAVPDFPEDVEYGRDGWKERAGWLTGEDGAAVSPHAVAGALADLEPGKLLKRADVEKRVRKFLRPKETA